MDTNAPATSALVARDVSLSYGGSPIVKDLNVAIPDESLTVIIGPNACGKSTLLRALARLLKPVDGSVILNGRQIRDYGTKEVARQLGLLPQTSTAPDGITVADLVARGRFPHQNFLRPWSADDDRIVSESMRMTHVDELADRHVDELSGGQRQRVWLAMALAQQTPHLLLDEPTTYLDIAHQVEVLDLCAALHAGGGRTLVLVLHELNLAARYATHLIVMKAGRIVAQGDPRQIVTAELIEYTYDLPCSILADPETGTPLVIPKAPR